MVATTVSPGTAMASGSWAAAALASTDPPSTGPATSEPLIRTFIETPAWAPPRSLEGLERERLTADRGLQHEALLAHGEHAHAVGVGRVRADPRLERHHGGLPGELHGPVLEVVE